MRPTHADFVRAIGKAARLQIINPLKQPIAWGANLYDDDRCDGDRLEPIQIGLGDTAGEAMAFAWLAANDPDILIDGALTPENWIEYSSYEVPPNYRFEVFPPWTGFSARWIDPDDPDDPDEGPPTLPHPSLLEKA
jgi:hypothetical protein